MRLDDIPKEIEACVDTETGEIIDIERLDALQMERDEKIGRIHSGVRSKLSRKNLRRPKCTQKQKRKKYEERNRNN